MHAFYMNVGWEWIIYFSCVVMIYFLFSSVSDSCMPFIWMLVGNGLFIFLVLLWFIFCLVLFQIHACLLNECWIGMDFFLCVLFWSGFFSIVFLMVWSLIVSYVLCWKRQWTLQANVEINKSFRSDTQLSRKFEVFLSNNNLGKLNSQAETLLLVLVL